jgi:3-hydroxybutyryl-CoA dehydrogenase
MIVGETEKPTGPQGSGSRRRDVMQKIRRAAVIGAGTMGHGIAQCIATGGISVALVDEKEELLDRARAWIRGNLDNMIEIGETDASGAEAILGRIRFTTDMAEAVREADFVTEAIFENLELKKEVFRRLGASARPEAILVSNTSSFDSNEFTRVTVHPERVLGVHWFHPPWITPCVEVIPAEATSPETVATVLAFLEGLGKVPTVCKSAPGFVANRIQYAVVSEALAIIDEGLATPEEVDRIVKTSFGFRLGAYGPCETCDQAGLDIYSAIFKYFHDTFKRDVFTPPKVLAKLTGQGRYGLKSGKGFYDYEGGAAERLKKERDRKLFARLRLLREEMKAGG